MIYAVKMLAAFVQTSFATFGLIMIICRICCSHPCKVNGKTAHCANKDLQSIPQDLPKDITKMDIRKNRIKTLPNNVFARYKGLTSLHLDKNHLTAIATKSFDGLQKLHYLTISENFLNISAAYAPQAFEPLESLKHLNLERNMELASIGEFSYPFLGCLHHLLTLSIDLALSPNFKTGGFKHLKKLRVLVFDTCNLEHFTNQTFSDITGSIEELYLKNCMSVRTVQQDFLFPFTRLQVLSIYHSNMELSTAFRLLYPFENKHMKAIEFTMVNPGYKDPLLTTKAVILSTEMVMHLQRICVTSLMLVQNGIVEIEPNTILKYDFSYCLKEIVLSGNRFPLFEGFSLSDWWSLVSNLTNLTLFDVSFNPFLMSNIKLHEHFPHQRVYGFDEGDMDRAYSTESKTTCNSKTENEEILFPLPPKLKTLRLPYYVSNQKLGCKLKFTNASSLEHLDLENFGRYFFPEMSIENGSNIKSINLSQIFTWKKSISLFQKAKVVSLSSSGIWNDIQHHPTYFDFAPEVEKLDISWNNLWQLRKDTFLKNKNLESLDIHSNLFDDFPVPILKIKSLKVLDARWNILDNINKTIRNYFDRQQKQHGHFYLLLKGNVFKCVCETIEFVRWLNKTKVTFDADDYKCMLSNGSVTTTKKVLQEFNALFGSCNSTTWLIIGIGLLVAFVVLAIPIALVVNYKWQISYWIYRKFKKVVELEMKEKFLYDIYVSYTNDTANWVKDTLVLKLEQSWGLKMCIEDRDILIGGSHADAIAVSISESRHVIFVINDTFLDKHWGGFEMQRAKYEKYTKSLQQIIVIAKGISVENFPSELENIWKDLILIFWDRNAEDEHGWDKLRMALFTEFI